MDKPISITPITYTKTLTESVDNIIISVVEFVLFERLTLQITLRSGENVIDIKGYVIQGNEYEQWGDDDNYIVNLITSKFNLMLSN